MIARIIMPDNGIRPAIKSLETGTHFMCRRTSDDARDKIGIYQVVNNDPGILATATIRFPQSTALLALFVCSSLKLLLSLLTWYLRLQSISLLSNI